MLYSRDNPSFLAVVLICGLFLGYSNFRAIDYFPAFETSRMLTYPLLATGVTTLLLRPSNRFAKWGFAAAVALSLETICKIAGLPWGAHNSAIAGFYQLVKLFWPLLGGVGVPYHVRDLLVYTLVTCMIYCVCAKAFSSSRWLILIVAFLLTFAATMFIVSGLAMVFDGWFVWFAELWFMLIHTVLFWHFVAWSAKRDGIPLAESIKLAGNDHVQSVA